MRFDSLFVEFAVSADYKEGWEREQFFSSERIIEAVNWESTGQQTVLVLTLRGTAAPFICRPRKGVQLSLIQEIAESYEGKTVQALAAADV